MTRLIWNESGSRYYETGVDRGVFYPPGKTGVPWNGLVSVREAPSGSGKSERYFDGEKYYVESTADSFSGTIEAFTYPEAFEPYDGMDDRHLAHQRSRKPFNLSYRTMNGDDVYSLHLAYNVLVEPTARPYTSQAEDVEPITFSWDFTTLPVHVPGAKPTAHIIMLTRISYSWTLKDLEDVLYGKEGEDARFPTPQEVMELVESNAVVRIVDHGDGTWSAIGPDDVIQMLDDTTFQIDWPSAVYLDEDTYRISSL